MGGLLGRLGLLEVGRIARWLLLEVGQLLLVWLGRWGQAMGQLLERHNLRDLEVWGHHCQVFSSPTGSRCVRSLGVHLEVEVKLVRTSGSVSGDVCCCG